MRKSRIEIEYLQANGRYRKETSYSETQWPTFLINHHDRQAHTLIDNPVGFLTKPIQFKTWEEFVNAPVPPIPHQVDKLMVVCEDNNPWPISLEILPDMDDRLMQEKDLYDEAAQSANATATREATGSGLMAAWSIVSLGIFCIVSVILVLFFLQSEFAKDIIENPVVALPTLLILLGTTLAVNRPIAQSATKTIAAKLRNFETVRVFDEMAGFFWSASLPLEILAARLGIDCRYTQETLITKLLGVGAGAVLFFVMGNILFLVLKTSGAINLGTTWTIIGSLLLFGPVGALGGWLRGYKLLMVPPVWIVRRLYARTEEQEIIFDADPVILEQPHTQQTGMTKDEVTAIRRQNAMAVLASYKAKGRSTVTSVSGTTVGLNIAMAHAPHIFRATTTYEMIMARDLKEDLKGPKTASDRIKEISMAGMALGSVGLLVFVILISS